MRRVISIVALLALPPLAAAFDEPTGFKDVPFGASAREVMEKAGPATVCSPATATEQQFEASCSIKTEISKVPVNVQFWLFADSLGSVEISFTASDYSVIHDAFIDRYGAATYRFEEAVTDRSGNKVESEVLRWDGQKTTITLRQYEDGTETGSASLRTNEYSRLLDKRRVEGADAAGSNTTWSF